MDNLTHSVAGLLMAEAVVQLRAWRGAQPSRAFAMSAAWVSVAGNNLPDLDFLYAGITPGKLGYLLHHRGHTHTVIGALAAAGLVFGATLLLWRWRRSQISLAERRWILALCVAAPLAHVALDYTNSYGTHPFWPVVNRWFYGDFVFIIEPWYWVFAVPALFFATKSLLLRGALALVLITGLGLAWFIDWVAWGVALSLTVSAIGAGWLAARLRPGPRLSFGLLGCLLVSGTFFVASRSARARVPELTEFSDDPRARDWVDVVITPSPGNPLCFGALLIDTLGGRYRLRTATLASIPTLYPAERCSLEARNASLPLSPSTLATTPAIRWGTEWSAPLSELLTLNRSNCQAAAFLRFARVPYWFPVGADTLHLGDLRYDREKELGFAELLVSLEPEQCPSSIPSWIPPRHDLLGH